MDLYRAMAVFVRVVEHGSMTAAAERSDISPTAVSNYVRLLERHLGTSLLRRTTRSHSLTDFGSAYFQRCVEILGLVNDAETLAAAIQTTPRGRLRITAPATFGTERLMPALADYAASHESVELDVVLTDSVLDSVEEGIDVSFRLGALRDTRFISRPLAPYQMLICASSAYLAKRGRPLRPKDLEKHECMAFAYSSRSEWRSARSEWRMTGPDGRITIQVSGRVQVDSAQGLRQAALNGMGIAMLPEVLVEKDLTAGNLVKLLGKYRLPSRPLNLVYLKDRRMSPKLRSFIDFAIARFGA